MNEHQIVPIKYILENKDSVIVFADDLTYAHKKELIKSANEEYAKKKLGGLKNK